MHRFLHFGMSPSCILIPNATEWRIPFSAEAKKISVAYRCSVFCEPYLVIKAPAAEGKWMWQSIPIHFTDKADSINLDIPHIYRKWWLTSTAESVNRSCLLWGKQKASCIPILVSKARNNSITKIVLLHVCLVFVDFQGIHYFRCWAGLS